MQASAEKIWAVAQGHLRSMLSGDTYSLWFAPLRAASQDNSSITLEVANDFCEVWLKDNYLDLLQKALVLASGHQLQVRFRVGTSQSGPAAPADSGPSAPKGKTGERTADQSGAGPEIGFNPKNTFESFVIGNNNNFAAAAARAVAEAPGKSYNPLFLYGGVGLGKTHLLHAIGQFVANRKKNARVAYVSCEKFTNEYIDSIQNSRIIPFRQKYRQSEVLLIDDIQFLAGKERIQEEFFHTFNALHDSRRQIVLTCDRPASEIQNLEKRLVSRFEWGLVTDLQPPDIEMRLAILQKKAQLMNVKLSEEVMNFLAKRIRSNIRRLEGALIRVAAYAGMVGRPLSLEMVETLLHEILHEEGRTLEVSIDLIQKKVAEHYDIRLADMTSKRRPESVAFPRQVAMFLARQMTSASLNDIGEAFGGRDHGTVLYACRLVKDRMEVDASIRQRIGYIEKQIGG